MLTVIPAPLHRPTYLGEVKVTLQTAWHTAEETPPYPSGFTIELQYWEDYIRTALEELAKTETGLAEVPKSPGGTHNLFVEHEGLWYPVSALPPDPFTYIRRGPWSLAARDDEPTYITFEPDGSDPIDAAYLNAQLDDLARLTGMEFAAALVAQCARLLHDWEREGANERFLRFTDPARYNELFLDLCGVIASETGGQFDRRAKLQEILEFWADRTKDVNVNGQLRWYATHGPTRAGESQEDYEADAADFRALVESNESVTRRQLEQS